MGRSGWLCVLLVLAPGVWAAEDKIPVVNEDAIGKIWTLPADAKLHGLAYPPGFGDRKEEVCLAVGYLINPDGHASDLSLLKSWSSGEPRRDRDQYWGAYAGVASAELSRWTMVPVAEAGTPRAVYTVATFVFASPNADESSKRCAIPSLNQRIRELMQSTRAHRRMASSGLFSQLDLDPTRELRGGANVDGSLPSNFLPAPPPPPPPPPPTPKP